MNYKLKIMSGIFLTFTLLTYSSSLKADSFSTDSYVEQVDSCDLVRQEYLSDVDECNALFDECVANGTDAKVCAVDLTDCVAVAYCKAKSCLDHVVMVRPRVMCM